jgi:hypothetical protein
MYGTTESNVDFNFRLYAVALSRPRKWIAVPLTPNGLNREMINALSSTIPIEIFKVDCVMVAATSGLPNLLAALSLGKSMRSLLQPTTNCPRRMAKAMNKESLAEN